MLHLRHRVVAPAVGVLNRRHDLRCATGYEMYEPEDGSDYSLFATAGDMDPSLPVHRGSGYTPYTFPVNTNIDGYRRGPASQAGASERTSLLSR